MRRSDREVTDIRTNRKNIRAGFHDYSGGDYFIPICTHDRTHYFGEIYNGEMHLSKIGLFARDAMETLYTHYSNVRVPLYVIMPNHIHAIISINIDPSKNVGTHPGASASHTSPILSKFRSTLSVVVGGFKQSVTRFARENNINFGWQKCYHDHIIRGIHDGNRISEYIINNVAKWANDCYNE